MSLSLRSLVTEKGVTCAVSTPSKLVIGLSRGVLRVFSRADLVLERELVISPSPVVQLAALSSTEVVAVIANHKCTVHDLGTRQQIFSVDSQSAKYVVAVKDAFVIASRYKLRILRFTESSKFASISVVDSPGRARVRCLGTVEQGDDSQVYTVLGTKTPRLWRVDGLSKHDSHRGGRLTPLMLLNPTEFSGAHEFSLCGASNSLILASTNGSLYVKVDPPVQITQKLPPLIAASVVTARPLNINLLAVLARGIEIVNPATGNTILVMPLYNVTFVGPMLALHNQHLVSIDLELSRDQLLALHPSEAAKLAFTLPADEVTPEVRAIEQHEAASEFESGEIDTAMQMLLTIEEQETQAPFENNAFATKLLLPYLESTSFEELSSEPSLPSKASTLASGSSSNRRVRYHPLNSSITYLTYTRRKLRLVGVTDKQMLANVDTALFLCYAAIHSPLLPSLVRSKNNCDPEIVEPRLLESGKWRDLVAFCKSHGKDRRALDLLAEHEESPEVIFSYLKGVQDLLTVFDYSKPLLPEYPSFAEELFYHRKESSRIYEFLKEVLGENAADKFAKFAVHAGDETPTIHERVAIVLAFEDVAEMLQFLKTSKFIAPAKLVRNPAVPLEGRAVLFEKMGDFRGAIDTYLELGDDSAAQNVAQEHKEATYLFDKLVEKSPKAAAQFLNTLSPPTDLDLQQALSKLAPDFPVQEIAPYITRFTAASTSEEHGTAAKEAISRRALAEESIEQAQAKQKRHLVSNLDACTVCHKRLGKAVTSIVDENAMHYSCFKNQAREKH